MTKSNYLFFSCAALFFLHQYVQWGLQIPMPFVDSYLDDVLCMPIFLSLFLWERRVLLKNPSYTFSLLEITLYVFLMGCIFEFIFPRWSTAFTRDEWDFLAYAVGAGLFYVVAKAEVVED